MRKTAFLNLLLCGAAIALGGCGGSSSGGASTAGTVVVAPEAAQAQAPTPTPSPTPSASQDEATEDAVVAAFRMAILQTPIIPGDVAFAALGPWHPDADNSGGEMAQRRIEENYMFLLIKDAEDFHIHDIEARNHGPLIRGSHVPGISLERISVTNGRRSPTYGIGIATLSNGIGDAVFRDLRYIGDPALPAVNSNDAWAAIALKGKDANDTGHFVINRFDFENMFMEDGENYANADGISTERGYTGAITNGRVMNASDACLDIKGDVRIDNVFVAGCRQGLKLWADQHHGLIEIGTNRVAGIIGKGTGSGPRTIHIDTLILSGNPNVPLFRAEDGVVNLVIGTLVASKDQVITDGSCFAGSQVSIDRRVPLG